MQAVILAAGRGARLAPLTETIPKPLISLNGKTILDYTLESLPEEINEVCIIIKHMGEKIRGHVATLSIQRKIICLEQTNPVGTWGALLTAREFLKNSERFLVLSGDDFHDRTELHKYIQAGLSFGIQKKKMPKEYWAIETNANGFVSGLREQGAEETENGAYVATGVYLLDKNVFGLTPITLRDGELGLPQTLLAARDSYPLRAVVTQKWHPLNTSADLETIKSIR